MPDPLIFLMGKHPAELPVELAQTCAGVGVIGGMALQSTSLKHAVTSLRVGVTVPSVVARYDLYCMKREP